MTKPFVSIVIAVYNEEANIDRLLQHLIPVLEKSKYEIIFVNDGSKDNSLSALTTHAEKSKNIKVLSFSRNFGQQMAFTAGYAASNGDVVITMDADLQDPPEIIPELVRKWQDGHLIVYAQRAVRHEGFFKQATARFFYQFINALSEIPIPQNVGDFRLLDRKVVDVLNALPEKGRFLRGLVAWEGFSPGFVSFNRPNREAGETNYPLSKMISFAIQGITSFSTRPLHLATLAGFIASLFGVAGILYAIILRIFFPSEFWVTGWTAIFVAISFFGGVQLITIGIIGEYIGKIYKQVQGRPLYIIEKEINL